MREPVGLIGLGIMGRPMAENLIKAGFELWVYDLNPAACAEMADRGATCVTPQEMGQGCKTVLLILPDGAAVRSALFGREGIAQTLGPGSLVCDMSSTAPEEAKACAKRLAVQRVGFLDAPVSGGQAKAVSGELVFMVGGKKAELEKMHLIMAVLGNCCTHMGPVGCGCAAKLCNQIMTTLNIAAIAEAFALAERAGLDPSRLFMAIRKGSAASAMLESRAQKLVEREFSPGGKISTHLKDIENALLAGEVLGAHLPLTHALQEILLAHNQSGHGQQDSGSLLLYYEERVR